MTTLQEALATPGCERLLDFYSVGPVQRAAVESFVAALAPQPAQGVGRTNPGDETGGAVERFGWQTFLGKSPKIIPATNGSFVWYSDYLKLWQSAQPEDGCAPNHMCNGHRVHIPTGECCNKCGATSW